jgi:hypothetical protein
MLPSLLRPVVALLILSVAVPVWAADETLPVAPTAAVAAAWASEGAAPHQSSTPMKAMMASYAAVQGFDMASTIRARQAGAREANPLMAGSYGRATAMKALLSAGALGAAGMMAKKNRKAAIVTMIALNVASAAVTVNNMKTVQHLSRR